MQTRTSWLPGLALLVAFGAVFRPTGDARTEAKGAAQDKKAADSTGGAQSELASGAPRASRSPTSPASCKGQTLIEEYLGASFCDVCKTVNFDLDVVIATVPDPVESGLDWVFDSSLAAIRDGYGASGFLYDRASLPWYDEGGALRKRASDEKEPVWSREPGVMLFRGQEPAPARLRLLYLVGETPTTGVWKGALAVALRERAALLAELGIRGQPNASVVRILGPTFSGSSRSLRLGLESVLDLKPSSAPRVLILSGSATSAANVQELTGHPVQNAGCEGLTAPPREPVTFCATIHPDADLDALLQERLAALFPRQTDRRVLLLKEASAYGTSATAAEEPTSGDRSSFLEIKFPISVSGLREAYEDKPAEPQPSQGTGFFSRRAPIPLTLKELRTRKEPPAPTSPLNTAFLEQFFAGIDAAIRTHRTELVGIMATDVRDTLFLAREIARRHPEVKLLTFESNLLYLWPDFGDELRGMLVLSTYPLIQDNQRWTATSGVQRRSLFGNGGAEGIFNATLVHLNPEQPLIEYRAPFQAVAPHAPPVWLSAVGWRGMIPLAIKTEPTRSFAGYLYRLKGQDVTGKEAVRSPLLLWLPALALLAAIAPPVLRTTAFHRKPAGRTRRDAKPNDIPAPETAPLDDVGLEASAAALYLVLACALAPFPLLACGFLLPSVQMRFELTLWVCIIWAVLLALLLGAAALLVASSIAVYRASRSIWSVLKESGAGSSLHWWRWIAGLRRIDVLRWAEVLRWIALPLTALWIAVLGIRFALTVRAAATVPGALSENPQLVKLFLRRTFDVSSGLSSLLPLLLLAGLFIVVFLAVFLRHNGLARRTPLETCVDELPERLAGAVARARDRKNVAFSGRASVAVIVGLGLLAAYLAYRDVSWTAEDLVLSSPSQLQPFRDLLRVGVVFGVLSVGWFLYRFFVIWLVFRDLLEVVADVPAAAALARLPRRLFRLSFLVSPHRDPLLRPAIVGAVSDTERRLWDRVPEAWCALVDGQAPLEAPPSPREVSSEPPSADAKRTARVLRAVVRGLASAGRLTLIPRSKACTVSAENPPSAAGSLQHWIRAAEEYFSLNVAVFIEDLIGQLWSVALTVLATLVLLGFLLSSYPFGGREFVRPALVVLALFAFVTLATTATRASRDTVLSLVSGTEPDKVTWDLDLFIKIALFLFMPLLSLAGSEYPGLVRFLTALLGKLPLGTLGIS